MIRLADVVSEQRELRDEILEAWTRVLDSGSFVSGAQVEAFEAAFATRCEVPHAVAVSSGTDALVLILRALGVGPSDEVIVPASTFIATAAAVSLCGAVPVPVDSDATGAMDPNLVAPACTPRTKVVLPVHLYGMPADVDAIAAAVTRDRIVVVEDAAQAHLASHHGRLVGGLARAAAFSFYPAKNLGAPGEGGAVTTADAELAACVRSLRDHGQREKYVSTVVGTNARMSELVAATLRIKLRLLDRWTEARRRAASWYDDELAEVPGVRMLERPADVVPSWHLYPVFVQNRDTVRAHMATDGIETGVHYPVPIHLQPAYASLGLRRGSFPVAERMAAEVITLPMHASLTRDEVQVVTSSLCRSIERSER